MTTFKGTKGKWKMYYPPANQTNPDADKFSIGIENDPLVFAKVQITGNDLEEAEANAKLIAAAPELLEQLEQAKIILEIIDPENPAIQQMESVIKKATE